MKLYWIIIFSISAALASDVKYPRDDTKCSGQCKPLTQCPELWDNFLNNKMKLPADHSYTDYLKTLNCGYFLFLPFVCCPPSNSRDSDSDTVDHIYVENVDVSMKQSNPLITSETVTQLPAASSHQSTTTPEPTVKPKLQTNEENNAFAECGRTINRDHFDGIAEISDFPWLALLEYDTPNGRKFLCGGVLINDRYVLTAAHCVTSLSNKLVKVHLGEYDTSTIIDCVPEGNEAGTVFCVSDPVQEIGVEKTIVHEAYESGVSHRDDESTDGHDLALVKLAERAKFSYYVQPICLPLRQPIGKRYLVAGWSRSFIPNAAGHDVQSVSSVSTIDPESCRNHNLLPFVGEEHICAGLENTGERACYADAGGPLMGYERKDDDTVRLTVIGVSHMDLACDRRDLPGVYTRVIDYMPWIRKHITAQ